MEGVRYVFNFCCQMYGQYFFTDTEAVLFTLNMQEESNKTLSSLSAMSHGEGNGHSPAVDSCLIIIITIITTIMIVGLKQDHNSRAPSMRTCEVQRAGFLEAEPLVNGNVGKHWRQNKAILDFEEKTRKNTSRYSRWRVSQSHVPSLTDKLIWQQ